jgi:hypothetical protein
MAVAMLQAIVARPLPIESQVAPPRLPARRSQTETGAFAHNRGEREINGRQHPGRVPVTLLLLFCLVTAFLGCSRTVTGGYTDSPDNKYRLYLRTFGAYGHAFDDNTSKTLRITIVENDNPKVTLFTKDYSIRGSSVSCNSIWDKEDNVTVVAFDYGPGVDRSDGESNGSPTNHIRTLAFRFDPKSGKFTEQAAN